MGIVVVVVEIHRNSLSGIDLDHLELGLDLARSNPGHSSPGWPYWGRSYRRRTSVR